MPLNDSIDTIQIRWGPRLTSGVLLAFVSLVFVLTIEPFGWHLDYFARLGSSYRIAIIGVLLALAAFSFTYTRFRGRGIWRWELRILVASVACAVVVYSPLAVIVCVWIALASYGVGGWAIRRLALDLPSVARLAISIGIGLGVSVLALIPIGLAGLYGKTAFVVLLVTLTVIGRAEFSGLWSLLRSLDRRWVNCGPLRSPLIGVGMSFLPAFAVAFLMATLAPSIAYDSTSHHLSAARHYLLGGTLEPLPLLDGAFDGQSLFLLGHSVAYSYYPQSFEELITLAMGLGGQSAAQLITPLFFVLSLLMAAAIARLCGCSENAIVLGLIACVSVPAASWAGAIVKNDYPTAFFVLAALYCVLRAQGPRRGWLLLAAFFLGLSFGVKHVALFGAIPIGVLVLYRLWHMPRPATLAAVLAVVFAVSGLFWHVRTYVLTGSPTYPAGVGTAAVSRRAVDGSEQSTWARHLMYPWIAHFEGKQVLESPTANPLGFYFPFFSMCWVLTRRRKYSQTDRAMLVFFALYYFYWIYIWGVLRYAIALILLLGPLLAERVVAVSRQSRMARRVLATTLAYCLAFALLPTLILEVNAFQFPYFSGRLDREGYLYATMADYSSIEFINQTVGPEDLTLSINNCASAYAAIPAKFRCVRLDGIAANEKAGLVERLAASANPEYLLLPVEISHRELLASLDRLGYRSPIYQDEHYLLFARDRGASGPAG